MSEENKNETHSEDLGTHANEDMKTLLIPELNTSKLAFLGVLAFLFSSLEPFALFASIPFTISFLLYGKWKTFAMGVVGCLVAFLLVQVKFNQGSALGTFPLALIYGYLISRTIRLKNHPLQGIVTNGAAIFVVIMGLILLVNFQTEGGLRGILTPYVEETATQYHKSLVNAVGAEGEQLRQLKDVMDDPALVVDPILQYGTGFAFVTIMISFWVGTFVVLRMAALWRPFHEYPYDVKTLTSLKLPFPMVWPLMGVLALAIGHAYEFLGSWAEIVGLNGLMVFGVFYFFQGFGILSELLTYWHFFGFLRSMAIFFAVIMAYQILTLVGVLDTWIDFRRFFTNKNDEQNF